MKKSEFCPAIWLSGFFALGAIAHGVRFISGVSLVVAGHEIPLLVSAVVFLVFGALSAGALILGLKKPFCKEKTDTGGGCCAHSA